MYASYVGHDTVVNLLLESGADTSLGTDSGLTALMVAAGCGNESICYFLLQVTPSLFPSLSPPFPPFPLLPSLPLLTSRFMYHVMVHTRYVNCSVAWHK